MLANTYAVILHTMAPKVVISHIIQKHALPLYHVCMLLCCVHRLARLRWRNAFAVLGTWSQQSLIQSGCSQKGKRRVLPKVCS